MNNFAIKVEQLNKIYELYDHPTDRLKEALHPFKKKYHRDFYALKNVSFQIKKGETVGIIGKNGAGKSTLLKIITGVLSQTSGLVNTHGKIASLLELGAGFNPEMTGIENVYINGAIIGFTKEEMDKRIDSILEFADIGPFIEQPVKMYSSGMFARLAFAVAINVEPDILIVDEALSVGDMAFQAKCFNKFKEFQKANKTILFVTHSIDLILKYCQSAILINNGCLIAQGDVKDTTEKFRKSMVSIESQVIDDDKNSKIDIGSLNFKEQLPINNNANNYGSFEAEIIDFAVMNANNKITNHLNHGDNYTILLSVVFHLDILDPIFAFTIKSVDGMELTGTNSNNLGQVFGLVKNGERITIEFNQKMVLNSGNYFLALGCTKFESNVLKVFHRIYDAVSIDVVSAVSATGVAFSESKIKFERLENDAI